MPAICGCASRAPHSRGGCRHRSSSWLPCGADRVDGSANGEFSLIVNHSGLEFRLPSRTRIAGGKTMRCYLLAPLLVAALSASAQAQTTTGRTVCQNVWQPDWNFSSMQSSSGHWVQVCDSVADQLPATAPATPASSPQPDTDILARGPGSREDVQFDPAAVARKARAVAASPSHGSSLCPPPYHMTAWDGCQ